MLHRCEQDQEYYDDDVAFLANPVEEQLGPLPLDDGRFIYYLTFLKRGIFYTDYVDVIFWALVRLSKFKSSDFSLLTEALTDRV